MKKVGLLYREKVVEEVKKRWQSSQACIFVNFSRFGAFAFNTLRNELKKEKANMLVSRNTLTRRALNDLGVEAEDLVEGSTAMVFVGDSDIVKVCKVLVGVTKENESFVIKGGILKDKKVGSKDIEELSKLPSRDVLLATAIMTMVSPLSGFMAALNNVILKFVWLVEEIKKKKG